MPRGIRIELVPRDIAGAPACKLDVAGADTSAKPGEPQNAQESAATRSALTEMPASLG